MIHGDVVASTAGSPRARRRDANLGRILDAATKLVAEEGLEALAMGRVADAVDYTAGALYRYVESKDVLLSLVVQRILDDLRAELTAVAAAPRATAGGPSGSSGSAASPLARVVALVRAYRVYAVREPHRLGVLAIALATPRVLLAVPAQAAPVAAAVVATLTPLADALTAAAAAGELAPGDPVERTLSLFAMLHGLAQLPKLTHHAPGAFDVERLVRAGTRALLVGWGGGAYAIDQLLDERTEGATQPRRSRAAGTVARTADARGEGRAPRARRPS